MKPRLNINESFICKIWENPEYYSRLQTTDGNDIEIIDYGTRNYDSGPDYKNAKVRIDGKILAGDVEIHRDFKNWEEHNHQKDRRYNSVILHVVFWDSKERKSPKLRIKRDLPTVILSNFLTKSIHDVWQEIINEPSEKLVLPCYNINDGVDNNIITGWLNKLSVERLQLRSNRIINRILEHHKITGLPVKKKILWEQVLYEYIFEALGFSKNKEQMLKLASSVSLFGFKRHAGSKNSLKFIQAMLFGSSGLLFDVRTRDPYIDEIKLLWKQHEAKVAATGMKRPDWNFFRQRPGNFPTKRIAYGSQILQKVIHHNLLKQLVDIFKREKFEVNQCSISLFDLFSAEKDEYWEAYYDFGKKSKSKSGLLGKQRLNDIIMNVIVPFTYVYGCEFDDELIKQNALKLYSEIRTKADNSVVNVISKQVIKNRGLKIETLAIEQGVIQLYNFYCMQERCSMCEIGKSVFKDSGYQYKIIFY